MFLNSPLLWGLGLVSIPLIIHLLFRRSFRRIEWAPMKYLKLTIQRNRRRIQIEQFLLLLLRMALIALLVCMVARPVLNASGIGRWFGGDSRTSHILVLDDSLSMGLTSNGRTAFDRALELANQAIEDVGGKDRFTLVLSSRPKTPLLREVDLADRNIATSALQNLHPSESMTSWASALRTIDELIESSTYPTRAVTIITDLRRVGWEDEVAAPSTWGGDRVRVRIIDIGAASTRQVSLERLVQADRLALVGAPVRFEATIRNGSDSPLESWVGTWLIDGRPSEIALPALAAGETTIVVLTATFQEAGLHHVSLKLPADDLAGDNQRWDVVDVKENARMQLVDGEPSTDPFQSETDFLALALSLPIGESKAFQVEVVTDTEWATSAKIDPDLMVLANVATLSSTHADLLRKQVEAGMGLMIFPGDQVDPDSYNRQLFRDGAGILPVQLDAPSDEPVAGLILEENSPSPVDALRQLSTAVLERIKIHKRYQIRLPVVDDPQVRVLARWNDSQSSPALIEKLVGRGRVLFWTMAADKSWSDWPTEPSYVLAMREIAKAIAKTSSGSHELTAGEMLRRPLSGERRIQSPTVELPSGEEPRPLTVDSATTPSATADTSDAKALELTWSETYRAGLYRLNWQESPGGPASDLFAVNPDGRESDLMRISTDDLKTRWRSVEPEIIAAFMTTDSSVGVRGQEIWRTLAYWLAALMALESGFATFVGRQR
ncbi:BatA domain-containing protein [Schlesneria paludicola]|uniref:BatA domain-containing protein n=1 Tax=Schlesneria paludicola TaxID=360056 RepID=UPI001ED9224B|nr:BatA domain-containing protein [Schlesneria paludicola]